MSKNDESRNRPTGAGGVTRRQFLTYSAAAGLLAGASSLLAGWRKKPRMAFRKFWRKRPQQPVRPPRVGCQGRTLFFNFSHESDAQEARYYLVAGGQRYRLRRVEKGSSVLRQERRSNGFLRQVPDSELTHYVKNAVFSTDAVQLCYVIKNPDTTTGTWSMSSMFFQLPASSVLNAYERRLERLGTEEAFPQASAKRQLYGIWSAATPSELLEEEALKDSTDHATAIIGVHPELLSAEPDSAADIQKNYIATNGATTALSFELQRLGAATPQGGWAKLTPVTDENGQPFRNQKGKNKGLIQYHPDWNSAFFDVARSGASAVLKGVKNDPTLGADVTGLDPNAPNTHLRGRIWRRHDGVTTVDQSPMGGGDAVEDSLKFTLITQNTEDGYSCKGNAKLQPDGTTVRAELTFTNWFIRWLGIYLLFLDADGNPLDASGVELTTPPDYDPGKDRGKLASEKALFGLLLGPEFAFMGVPVLNSTATLTFDLPENVSSVLVFASGPSFLWHGALPDPKDPTTWGDSLPGTLFTIIINYGLTVILMAAGATKALGPIQKALLPLAALIVVQLIQIVGDAFRNKDFSRPDTWVRMAAITCKVFLTFLQKGVAWLIGLIVGAIALGEAEDAMPLAGQIAMGISLVAGEATLAETDLEIGSSPPSYVHKLALAHDLRVTIKPDPKNVRFPADASYYKVTALFDNGGTPNVALLQLAHSNVQTLDVEFRNVPSGGKVNVSVGFYTQQDRLVGKGTTGLVENTVGAKPMITIEQLKVPIESDTIYEHQKKTTLDGHGNHLWKDSPAPTVKLSHISCEGIGHLCKFQGITVRQGTSSAPGYLGYAWQGDSAGVVGCSSKGQGQLDQLANLGVEKAQSGYTTAPCGFASGVRLSYSLLTRGAANFYLDSTNNRVRQVRLDPTPGFDDPANKKAWGALNLDSDALLLHPSGRLVSINTANSKIEVLKIPEAALSDDEAGTKLLASMHSGLGSRPGLIDSPAAAAVSPQGVILILEHNNHRLQAFDLGGNPVQFFTRQKSPYFLRLDATDSGDTVYLDLAVEFTGYLYVLSYNLTTDLYRLDIYHPDQTNTKPISTTLNVNADKLTVDFWRNVYTLNYEVLKLPNGDVPKITEPSVSQWVPATSS